MTLSEISIRRPVFAWMLMAALIVFGAISFNRMGISQMPDVNFPVVNIALTLDNAAPEVMEMDVVDVIEDTVMGIEGLKNVSSSVSQGQASVTCEFELNHNIDVALQEVETRITQIQNRLPSKLYPPVITKTNPEDQAILWVMVSADESIPLYEQMIYARNTLKGQLSSISGVGDIILKGFVEPELRVWMDPKKMHSYDLTSSDILAAVQAEHVEQPAGRIEAPMKEFNIRVLGEAKTPEDFGKIRINARGGGANFNPIPISKVARVEEGISDLRAISRFNGKKAVGLGVVKQHGSNAVEVAKELYKKIDQIRPMLVKGYHLDVQLDSTKYIQDSVHELNFTLVLAALLTSIICFLFLGSWSSTINVLFSIPTSIVGAFIVLYFFGFTLNTFTLLGLSLAIGIVVDDAIMMLENIVRHKEMGKSRLQAALDGSAEITFAALAATLAIAAIFVPVIFMKGVVGRFFYQYGITVTAAVFLSLLEALTLTPMRCAEFLTTAKAEGANFLVRSVDHLMEGLTTSYAKTLRFALRMRVPIVILSVLFFAGSVALLMSLRQELIPEQDQSVFLVNLRFKVGTSITVTDQKFGEAEAWLHSKSEVQDVYSTVGNFQNNDVVNAGSIYVILKDAKKRDKIQRVVMDEVRDGLQKQFPEAEVFAQDLSLTGLSASRGYPIEFTLEGPDWVNLSKLSKEMLQRLRATGFFTDLNSDYQDGMPEIHVVPDRDEAAARGVSVNSMGAEVSNLVGGIQMTADTQYPKDGHRYMIRLRSDEKYRENIKDIGDVVLRNNRSGSDLVPVEKSAKIVEASALQLISRLNRTRAIPVYGNVAHGKSQQEALKVLEDTAKSVLPPGYRILITGSAQAFRDAFESLIFALILGIAVAYMVLASQFNSFIHPVTVLMALPFSLSGALLALYFTHQSLNLFSMIGLILLMGIVKKNSILLVDFTNHKRSEGMSANEALEAACPVRLRPILMTSVATVVGAIPGALALGPGSETRVPMAIAIIGGVTVSTVLTLIVVPCVYSLFVRLERTEVDEFI